MTKSVAEDFDVCIVVDVYSKAELLLDKTEARKANTRAKHLKNKLIEMCNYIRIPQQYQMGFYNRPEEIDICFLINLIEDATK